MESNTSHTCHEDGRAIQPKNPSSVHFPDVPCGFFGTADRVAYTSWLLGVKEESEGPEPLESSSVTRCHARAQGSGLNAKMAQELTACRGLGSKLRPPAGSIGAAQHPRIERAIIPATLNSLAKQPATTAACL
jgi:hypothetical protein